LDEFIVFEDGFPAHTPLLAATLIVPEVYGLGKFTLIEAVFEGPAKEAPEGSVHTYVFAPATGAIV
jgi:hypothetical protein